MIPLFTTKEPEKAANLLLARYRTVLIQAQGNLRRRIRFRTSMVEGANVYFFRVKSQRDKWQESGGALLTALRNDHKRPDWLFGAHDAIVMTECPLNIFLLRQTIKDTTEVGVIYLWPTWKPFEDEIRRRRQNDNPEKLELHLMKFQALRIWVESLPELTPEALDRLPRAPESSRLSFSHESREAGAHSPRSSC